MIESLIGVLLETKTDSSVTQKLKKQGKLQSDGTYDFDGGVNIRESGLKSISELGIKFGRVSGSFNCSYNQLTSLEGAPKEVGGAFYCENNNLTSLEGAPKEVGGSFHCDSNKLTSLEGAPKEVDGDFYCENNQLTSLHGAPKEVGGEFDCGDNKLTSLEGAPKEVGGNFYCDSNKLTSLHGAPKEVGGDFNCIGNKKRFTEEEVRAVCKVKGKVGEVEDDEVEGTTEDINLEQFAKKYSSVKYIDTSDNSLASRFVKAAKTGDMHTFELLYKKFEQRLNKYGTPGSDSETYEIWGKVLGINEPVEDIVYDIEEILGE